MSHRLIGNKMKAITQNEMEKKIYSNSSRVKVSSHDALSVRKISFRTVARLVIHFCFHMVHAGLGFIDDSESSARDTHDAKVLCCVKNDIKINNDNISHKINHEPRKA
ncbi:hypothetical protein ElyMa_000028500 [Elysia marginata]|uniref:Uncharacterized protein n=1 Tax=Elysia marginata TaxID=1093978 RepID=A0AAV4ECK1_9GAST|nr:hypothetical protein ElyMa_000028500 [Elysia marginata]